MAKSNQESKRHHFVPCFYTAQWALTDDHLIEWSRPYKTIKPIRRTPAATGYQDYLYTFTDLPAGSHQWFEDIFFKRYDNDASLALQEIINGHALSLTDELRYAWARFLVMMRFRHPDQIAELKDAIVRIWERARTFSKAEYDAVRRPTDPETAEEYLANLPTELHASIRVNLLASGIDNTQFIDHLLRMHWAVFRLNSGYSFLTSDWPVEASLGAVEPYISVPIAPRILFVASEDRKLLNRVKWTNPFKVSAFVNGYVVKNARRYVYSHDHLQERFILNNMSKTAAHPPFFPDLAKLM